MNDRGRITPVEIMMIAIAAFVVVGLYPVYMTVFNATAADLEQPARTFFQVVPPLAILMILGLIIDRSRGGLR